MTVLRDAYRVALSAAHGGARVQIVVSGDLEALADDLAPVPVTVDPALPPVTALVHTTHTLTREETPA